MRIKLLILIIFLVFYKAESTYAAISFTISNPVQNGDEITVDVSLSGLTISSCNEGSCYLQTAFTSPSPIRYFGFTKNHSGQLYEYVSSPDLDYLKSTFFAFQPIDGSWVGQLSLKVNPDSMYYKGPGEYNMKAWRYSGKSTSSSGNTDSISINIDGPTPTPSPTATSTLTPTLTSTPTPNPTKKSTPTPTKTPTITPTSTSSTKDYSKSIVTTNNSNSNYNTKNKTASIAGTNSEESTNSADIEVKGEKRSINYFVIFGVILILIGISSVVFIYLRTRKT